MRSRKSKNDRQHNGKRKKDKSTNNDLQNIINRKLKIEKYDPPKNQGCNKVLQKGYQFLLH